MRARRGLLLAALLGCAPADDGAGPERSTLTILDPNYEAIFNPSWSTYARFLVFSPLVQVGEDREVEPSLARRWEHSPDHREWTFHLRTDVRWHDGAPFTARDVAFTLRMMSDPEVAYRPRPEAVIVADDSTITIRRDRPWNALETWWVTYPEHLLGEVPPAEFFASEFWLRPVGTGPYRYARHVPRTVFELEADPDHFAGRPRVDRIRIKFGGGSPLAELESGNVDVATYVSRAQLARFRDDPRFRVHHHLVPGTSQEALYWNHRHPFLGAAAVRRALTMAIDRRELHRLHDLPEGMPIVDVPISRRQFRGGSFPPPLKYDPERARALLDSAGWRDADGDGVRERGPVAARFTVLLAGGGSAGTAAWERTAVYVQAALRRVGVAVEIERLEGGVMPRVRSGAFEAAFGDFSPARSPASEWGPDSPYGYGDPELHRTFAALDTTFDAGRRDSLYRTSWPIVGRDLPVTLLGPRFQHFVAHRRVRGLESPLRAHPYVHAARLWIEEEERK